MASVQRNSLLEMRGTPSFAVEFCEFGDGLPLRVTCVWSSAGFGECRRAVVSPSALERVDFVDDGLHSRAKCVAKFLLWFGLCLSLIQIASKVASIRRRSTRILQTVIFFILSFKENSREIQEANF